MARVSITIGKHKKGSVRLNRFSKKLPKQMTKALQKIGRMMVRQIQDHVGGQSHTRFPGNSNPFPGRLNSDLFRSVDFEPKRPIDHILVGPGGLASAYAAAQEYGTATIPARPYLRPALDKREDDIFDIFHRTLTVPL